MRKIVVVAAIAFAMVGWGSRSALAVCGDEVVDAGEDCDTGGFCIGGTNAGIACHVGSATCEGGGTCTTFGGKGCAANCTTEHDIPFSLIPGSLLTCAEGPNAGKLCTDDNECPDSTCAPGLVVAPGTSGVAIDSDFLSIPLPFGGSCVGGSTPNVECATDADCPGGTCVQSHQILTVGKAKDGKIPVVVKAASVKFPGIMVSTLACGCIHGISSKTCGGTFFDTDGTTLSANCTPGFSSGTCSTPACTGAGDVCEGKSPCAFVHGDGNTAAGEIGCDAAGMDGVDIKFEQDSGGESGACAAPHTCAPTVTFSGHGPTGSAIIFQTLGITAVLGPCVGTDPGLGADGVLCTDDDPPGGIISAAGTLPVTTGTATAVVHNANGSDGADLGPVSAVGAPFCCGALEQGDQSTAAGAGVVGAFTFVHLDTVGDVAVTAQLFASGTVPDPLMCTPEGGGCVGDCDGDGAVTVNELIEMVNIALENAPLSTCPVGDVDGDGTITVNEIIQGVNNALGECPA